MNEREYKAMLAKVMEYANKKGLVAKFPNEIGCKVKLSDFGIEMQGKDKRKLSGIVIDWRQWMHFPNDGTVTVKWDKISKPQDMHVSQVVAI